MTKAFDKKLISQILESPNAPKLLEELQAVLAEEQRKRLEFYNDITEQEKAEYINGEVIIHSPAKRIHNEVCGNIYQMLRTFVVINKLGFVGMEKILIQLTRNDYEPDVCFFRSEIAQTVQKDQSIFPAPDFIVEVLSKSTEARDRGIKFEDYQNHAVKEYWIVDAQKAVVEQYVLQDNVYDLKLKSGSGEIQSIAILDFNIPIKAIFDEELANQVIEQFFEK